MNKFRVVAVAALLAVFSVSTSHAIVGAGFHWGFDFSMSMEDVNDEKVNLKLPAGVSIPAELSPFYVSRENWKASPINFGGKAYIDFIPVIDAIEVSCNFGLWQYDGALNYVDVASLNGSNEPTYKKVDLTLDGQGMNYIGLGGTPYAKLLLDATVKKKVFSFPPDPLEMLKISAGGGMSVHFATPLLSASLVEEAFKGQTIDEKFLAGLSNPGNENSKAVVQKIIDEALGEPVFGMHIVLGAQFKLPVIPVGFYVDGKYMIPFTKFDEDKNISGFGLLLNAGISLSI